MEFEDFVRGLLLVRGTLDEQVFCRYLLQTLSVRADVGTVMFKMFRLKRGTSVTLEEFRRVTSSGIFAGKRETKEEKKQRVAELSAEIFEEFDVDMDRALDRREFSNWAKQSLEATILLDLFKKLDSVVTTSEGGKISGPTNVSHETHVGLTDGGGFAIDNIPPSWLSLFIDAGDRKSVV